MLTYEAHHVRADGIHTGGQQKLAHMYSLRPPVSPANNPTLLELSTAIAELCFLHYSTINIDELAADYGLPPTSTPDHEEPEDSDEESVTPASKTSSSALRISGRKTLDTHDELLGLFALYGGRTIAPIKWRKKDLKRREDLFKTTTLGPRHNNAFSSSFHLSTEGPRSQ